MGATRDVALNELPIRGISINADTTDNVVEIQVVPSDSGVIFINKEVEGTVTYTLPSVAEGKGKWFWFFNGQTSAAIVVTAGADTGVMVCTGYVDYDKMTDSSIIGASGFVFGDGDKYYFVEIAPTWTAGT